MFSELETTYRGKKVFLTGHTGFKGAWFLKVLNLLGAEVKGYSLAPENKEDLYNLINGDVLCESIIADLRNRTALIGEILSFQPDFIFHFAAQPLVRLSYQIPSETFEINVVGTANLLDGIRLLKKTCSIVIITTDKVYYNNEWEYPYRELDRLGGYDPYSASKACAELLIDSYRKSFFNQNEYNIHQKGLGVARAGNVIGGGDWSKDRLIPDVAKALSCQSSIIIRNPSSIRPWQHVLEPLKGYLLLGSKLAKEPEKYSQAYNFGPYATDMISVQDIVNIAIKSWGKGQFEIQQLSNSLHEAGLLKLDISKVVAELAWLPKLDVTRAIQMTIEWYKNYYNSTIDISAYTSSQIQAFFNE